MIILDKIDRLKKKARKQHTQYRAELGSLGCGASLGEYVNPRLRKAKLDFNKTMDELAKLDSDCPTARL